MYSYTINYETPDSMLDDSDPVCRECWTTMRMVRACLSAHTGTILYRCLGCGSTEEQVVGLKERGPSRGD